MVSSVCCEVILRVRGLALDISIEGAVRMCANVLTVPAILVSNSNQMQWCERGGGGGAAPWFRGWEFTTKPK